MARIALSSFTVAAGAAHAQWSPNLVAYQATSNPDPAFFGSGRAFVSHVEEGANPFGMSNRTSPNGQVALGQESWTFVRRSAVIISPTDSIHTQSNGKRLSGYYTTSNGFATGWASRYNVPPLVQTGVSAWIYRDGVTTLIGLTGPAYTASNGRQENVIAGASPNAYVAGWARHPTNNFATAWRWHDGSIVTLGLTSPDYTAADGLPVSFIEGWFLDGSTPDFRALSRQCINSSGQVTGCSSVVKGGSTQLGVDAWISDAQTTTRIGLTGPDFVRADGFRDSRPMSMNQQGDVVGTSVIYSGSQSKGTASWLYRNGTTTRLAPVGAVYTSPAGEQITRNPFVLDDGSILLSSIAWHGPNAGATTHTILLRNDVYTYLGLTEGEHTGRSGQIASGARPLTQDGIICGTSSRFDAFGERGETHWWYTHATGCRPISPNDPDARVYGTSSTGLMVGTLDLNTGFLLNPRTATLTELSYRLPGDMAATTNPFFVSDSGRVLGTYNRIAADGSNPTGYFIWTERDGFADLMDLINGGPAASHWSSFTQPLAITDTQVIFRGIADDGPGTIDAIITTPSCTADFNSDGDFATDADIEAFFACLAGHCCPTCATSDFNDDGDFGTDADIESFFRVLAGGPC